MLCTFFIRKYKWTLHNALEFLNTRRPNLEIRASFYEQMLLLEGQILRNPQFRFRFPEMSEEAQKEELVLSNTFGNAVGLSIPQKLTVLQGNSSSPLRSKTPSKIRWVDEMKKNLQISEEIVDQPIKKKLSFRNSEGPKNSNLKSGKRKKVNRVPCSDQDEKNISTTSSTSASENPRNSGQGIKKKEE